MSNPAISLTVRYQDADKVKTWMGDVNAVPRVDDTISFELRDPVTDALTGQVVLYKVVAVTWNFQHHPAALVLAEKGDTDAKDIMHWVLN